jgi:hypothetical protein
MDKSRSSPKRLGLFPTKSKSDKAINTTLDVVDTSLKALDGVVNFLPGVGAVVNVLQEIMGQLRVSMWLSYYLCWNLTL